MPKTKISLLNSQGKYEFINYSKFPVEKRILFYVLCLNATSGIVIFKIFIYRKQIAKFDFNISFCIHLFIYNDEDYARKTIL